MNKNIVLSETKQTVLATLYLMGVRKIIIQDNDLALWMMPEYPSTSLGFGGNFPFLSEEFSFEELRELGTRLILSDIIKMYCPKYLYVLNYDPFGDD